MPDVSERAPLPSVPCSSLLGVALLSAFLVGGASACAAGDDDAETGTDSGAETDDSRGDPATTCFEAWADPIGTTTARTRPDRDDFGAMSLQLSYSVSDDFVATVVLDKITGRSAARPSDGPFSVGDNSGSWLELRDEDDAPLYTRGVYQLVPEYFEVPPPPGGDFENVVECPTEGALVVHDVPNDERATHVVLFQEPIDGELTFETVELLRVPLP